MADSSPDRSSSSRRSDSPPFIDEADEPDDGSSDRNREPGRIEIELATNACMAHGICMELAPAYFTPDEDGDVSLAPGSQERGESPELELAAASCPMRVINVRSFHPASSEDLHR
jgi:ferredoxin